MASYTKAAVTLLLLLFCYSHADGDDRVQSQILSTVSDGKGGYKVVKGVAKHAVLRANFTNRINTTGYVRRSTRTSCLHTGKLVYTLEV